MTEVHDPLRSEQRMTGAAVGQPALERGATPSGEYPRPAQHHPAAEWGGPGAWPES
jgi:hypothetical protein